MKRKDKKKTKPEKSDFEKRKFNDADIMREKQKKAEERKKKEEEEEEKKGSKPDEKPKKKQEKAKMEIPNYLKGFTGGPGVKKEQKHALKEKQKKKG